MGKYTKKEMDEMRLQGISFDENGNPDTKGKTENFFTRHVKLITFLCCLTVFLAVFGPWSIFRIMDYIEEKSDTRPYMTGADLLALSELDRNLYYDDIKGFKGQEKINSHRYSVDLGEGVTEMREEDKEIYYYMTVDGRYQALAVADIQTGMIIYFRVTDPKSNLEANVLTDNIADFLAGIPKKTTAATTAAATTTAATTAATTVPAQ